MRGRALFVTGTDTGVGKTWVSSRLAESWTAAGVRTAALKLAESGCRVSETGLVGEDAEQLFQAAGAWQPERTRYLLEPAIAPGVAADDAGITIDFDVLAGQVDRLREQAVRVIAEGAGGWIVPMGRQRTVEDLAVRLGLPVLIAARAGLGTINHSVLTVRAVRAAGLPVLAIAMSRRPDDDPDFAARNAAEIEQLAGVPVVRFDADHIAASADRIAHLLERA